MLAVVYFAGPMPVPEAIERCEEILRLGSGHGEIEVSTRAKIAGLEAMRGDFDRARELYRRSKQVGDEFGLRLHVAAVANYSGPIELLAGDPERAEHELRGACRVFEELGETATLATSAAILARVLDVRGERDEAMRWTEVSEASAPGSDLAPQFMWRSVRAKLLARRGAFDTALVLGTEAVDLAGRSDFSGYRGETLLDLAELLELTGDGDAAATAAAEARALFAAKGNQVLAESARLTLARLRSYASATSSHKDTRTLETPQLIEPLSAFGEPQPIEPPGPVEDPEPIEPPGPIEDPHPIEPPGPVDPDDE
jgi:ATP/maltotriose-dependent transcriptional regulator MalT